MKIGIVGSRDFPCLDLVVAYVESLPSDTVVVSGGARGVDGAAANAARDVGLVVVEYLPDWSKGKQAGLERNTLIVEQSDRVVAFWDGKSRGTIDTICKANRAGKPVDVILADGTHKPNFIFGTK
jgi:predicted Rossmann fold nucleotide-binding protein DprA/Smf involved in DNA uptake